MSEQQGPLYQTIDGLSGFPTSDKEIAAVQDSLNALLKHNEVKVRIFKNATDKLKSNYHKIINEAKTEADKIKAEAAEILQNAANSSVDVMNEANESANKIRAKVNEEIKAWTEEKAKLAHIQDFSNQVKVDVGGFKFTTTIATLCRIPESMLGAMFSGRHSLSLNEEGYHFIDRDGTHFRLILNFLRSPETWHV